jgi:N-acetylneuraminic acid mutarotase
LLPNGQVLVAGGASAGILALNSAEIYTPSTKTWTNTSPLNSGRSFHTAALLRNGKVLVAGGIGTNSVAISSAELYDPDTAMWTPVGAMNTTREFFTATLLPNGKILAVGGQNSNGTLQGSAELYDPATQIWTPTGSLNKARMYHTATLLPNGNVLVAGGQSGASAVPVSELYNPATGLWVTNGTMNAARYSHSATLLPNGKVLVLGGAKAGGVLSSAELYDPATGAWTTNGSLSFATYNLTATLLPSGRVLAAGGETGLNVPSAASALFDGGLGFTNSWQPEITSVTSPLDLGSALVITGTQFRGVSEGSSGKSQDSSADFPLVQLISLESGQSIFLPATNYSANSLASPPVWNFPPGYALATVFVNGIPSVGSIVSLNVSQAVPAILSSPSTSAYGAFQFGFTNSVGAVFGILATTDLAQPQTNWTAVAGVTEVAPGQFQFIDPSATNFSQRFYLLISR